jgi:pantoate--beta-alanine ligase
MKIIRSCRQMLVSSRRIRQSRKRIGFVPTMGYLHEGHLSLVKQARKDNEIVVMSIFVNPIQFGPKEDLKRYPRDLKRDIKSAKAWGVDIIFYPTDKSMYPQDFRTYVKVDELSNVLCGKSRPHHFRGVATVVSKLFNIVEPDIAYFGQKDAQQAIIIKRMARDLNMPLKIKILPIIRERDGLAMSSRNSYLDRSERIEALVLNQALKLAKALIKRGERKSGYLIKKMKALINKKEAAKIDYVQIVDLKNLTPVRKIKGRVLIALAIWIGRTRLIDNLIIDKK